MSEAARLDGVRYFGRADDIPMKDWFERESYDRIFVLIGSDGVPLNFDPASGYSIGPDAEDENWIN